jgi:hypothetical protein
MTKAKWFEQALGFTEENSKALAGQHSLPADRYDHQSKRGYRYAAIYRS